MMLEKVQIPTPRIETLIVVESSLKKQHLETNPKICWLSGVYLDDPGKAFLSDYNTRLFQPLLDGT